MRAGVFKDVDVALFDARQVLVGVVQERLHGVIDRVPGDLVGDLFADCQRDHVVSVCVRA